jgi:aminopeptidase N
MLSYKQWVELGVNIGAPPEDFPQILHLDANLIVDFERKSLKVKLDYKCKKFPYGSHIISFDGIGFVFEYVKINGKNVNYSYDGEKLVVEIPPNIKEDFTFSTSYSVTPKLGFYFIENQDFLECWTQGEAQDNRYWLLCIDYPNQKFTVSLTVDVPLGYTVVANGRLQNVKDESSRAIFSYKIDWPVTSYLIAVAAA